jgi:predicted CXXCH cytochrome family protein
MRLLVPAASLALLGILLPAPGRPGSNAAAQDAAAPPAVRQRPHEPVAPDSCATAGCHEDVTRHEVLHGPITVNACDACHAPLDETAHTFTLARRGEALCTFCHDVDTAGLEIIHQPVADGQCTACHDPHGGANRASLKADTGGQLCLQCHEDVVGGLRVRHGPVAAGACLACHTAHGSTFPGLLERRGADLCNSCHVNTRAQAERLRVVHEPVRHDCETCHDPHASDHEMMLAQDPQTLCLGCHETIRHTIETAATQHAAVTTERSCLNCHEAHASDFPRLLQQSMTELCFECHDKEIELENDVTLGNIKQIIATGKSLHGPVAQHNCAACHLIHGGDNFRLLTQEYPPEFYAPFAEESYALCFSCHDKQLVHDERTTSLTGFRNGDVNLHFLHVNRERKGRTCRACHETHASSKAKHVRDAVPFGPGGWKLPIRFEKLETGGSCAPGCHAPYRYDRDDPVAYPPPTEPAIWPSSEATPPAGDEP